MATVPHRPLRRFPRTVRFVSGGAALAQDLQRRLAQEPEIEPERPAPRVADVHVERLAERRVRPRGHLPQAGDARGDEEALEVVRRSQVPVRVTVSERSSLKTPFASRGAFAVIVRRM